MTGDLQDKRQRLLAELARLDERIESMEVNDLVDAAAERITQAKKLLAEVHDRDAAAKRERDEMRRAELAAKRQSLLDQVQAAELEYRGAMVDALEGLAKRGGALKPAEQAILANPERAPLQIAPTTYAQFDTHLGARVNTARANLSKLRRELAGLDVQN